MKGGVVFRGGDHKNPTSDRNDQSILLEDVIFKHFFSFWVESLRERLTCKWNNIGIGQTNMTRS